MQNNTQSSNKQVRHYARAAQAAKHFQIGKSTLWLWVKTLPEFPQPIKVGKRVTLFDLNAIESYFQQQAGGAS